MDGFTLRQGTVYEKIADGRRTVVINHDPMNLRAVMVHSDATGKLDLASPEAVSIEKLIDIRTSGLYRELGDLEPGVFQALLTSLIAAGALPGEELTILRSLISGQ